MTIFSVEKLAELCKVDRETVRRWRNRGVNGVKLEARQSVARRGAALLFDDSAVKAFMEANPKYLTKELSDALDPPETPATADYRMASSSATLPGAALSSATLPDAVFPGAALPDATLSDAAFPEASSSASPKNRETMRADSAASLA